MLIPIKDYNPTRNPAFLTLILIVINVVVFFYQSYFSEPPEEFMHYSDGDRLGYYIAQYAMVPAEVSQMENSPVLIGIDRETGRKVVYTGRELSPLVTLLTSLFMHGSLLHLAGNMLFLWIFGNNIEDYLGRLWFLFFYLVCGVGASLAHVLFNADSMQPVVGASGAISGIMGAYMILFPRARIRTLFFFILVTFIDIPAFAFLFVWFIMQFTYAGIEGGGIAWLAHVGGFAIGVLIIKFLTRSPRPPRPHIEIIQ